MSSEKGATSDWDRDKAIDLIAQIWPDAAAKGWYLGLTGSVLEKGVSTNDMDLIAYPKCKGGWAKKRDLRGVFKEHGMRRSHREVARSRYVEVWAYEGNKIDVFFLN